MKKLLGLIIIAVVIASIILPLIPQNIANADTWLTGYSYRRAIAVLHTDDGEQTGYQKKVFVNSSTGNSAGSLVYLNGSAANFPFDLRFTNSSGTDLLDYWIESYTATNATIWVEIDTIPAHASDFAGYLYFGKAGGTSTSNGTLTFGLGKFDDFEWGADGDAITTSGNGVTWSNVDATAPALINSSFAYNGTRSMRLKTTAGHASSAYFAQTAGTNYAIGWMVRTDTLSQLNAMHGNGIKETYAYIQPTTMDLETYDGSSHDTGYHQTANTWQWHEMNRFNFSTYKFDWYFGGTLIASVAAMLADATSTNTMYFQNAAVGWCFIDNVYVRKWTANEPAWGTWGAIENVPAYWTLAVTGSPAAGGTPTFTGSSPFVNGTVVNIFAGNTSCYTFNGWTPTGNITNPALANTSITMLANASLTANYVIKTFTLTYAAGAGGTINGTTPQTVNCGANGATVTAVANNCYYFINWSDAVATAARTDLNVNASISVTANFGAWSYGNPTLISCSSDGANVILAWAKGTNTSDTYIRYKIGSYPTSITDGNVIGVVSGYGYIHSGLLSGTSYYYRLWGASGDCRSSTNATIMCSTTAGYTASATGSLPITDTSGWNDTPNGSALENNPLYQLGIMEADAVGMPHNTWWFILGMGFLIVAGLFIFTRTNNLLVAVSVVIVFGGILSSVLAIIPIWCIVIFGIYALGVSWKELR